MKNLRSVIESFKHRISDFNVGSDRISIVFRRPDDDDEAFAKRRATRFKITALLAAVARLRRERQQAQDKSIEATPAKDAAASFQLPKDKGIDAILKPRRQRPPESPERDGYQR